MTVVMSIPTPTMPQSIGITAVVAAVIAAKTDSYPKLVTMGTAPRSRQLSYVKATVNGKVVSDLDKAADLWMETYGYSVEGTLAYCFANSETICPPRKVPQASFTSAPMIALPDAWTEVQVREMTVASRLDTYLDGLKLRANTHNIALASIKRQIVTCARNIIAPRRRVNHVTRRIGVVGTKQRPWVTTRLLDSYPSEHTHLYVGSVGMRDTSDLSDDHLHKVHTGSMHTFKTGKESCRCEHSDATVIESDDGSRKCSACGWTWLDHTKYRCNCPEYRVNGKWVIRHDETCVVKPQPIPVGFDDRGKPTRWAQRLNEFVSGRDQHEFDSYQEYNSAYDATSFGANPRWANVAELTRARQARYLEYWDTIERMSLGTVIACTRSPVHNPFKDMYDESLAGLLGSKYAVKLWDGVRWDEKYQSLVRDTRQTGVMVDGVRRSGLVTVLPELSEIWLSKDQLEHLTWLLNCRASEIRESGVAYTEYQQRWGSIKRPERAPLPTYEYGLGRVDTQLSYSGAIPHGPLFPTL